MQEKLRNWGFECTCSICKDRKATKKQVVANRNGLRQDLMEAFHHSRRADGGPDLAKAERLLAALEKTYSMPATAVPRLALWDPYLFLTRSYSVQQEPRKVVQTAWKVLASLGCSVSREEPGSRFRVEQWGLMLDCVIEAWLHLWTAYSQLGAPELCGEAEACARLAYKICVGEDGSFEWIYGEMVRKAIAKEKDLVEALEGLWI